MLLPPFEQRLVVIRAMLPEKPYGIPNARYEVDFCHFGDHLPTAYKKLDKPKYVV